MKFLILGSGRCWEMRESFVCMLSKAYVQLRTYIFGSSRYAIEGSVFKTVLVHSYNTCLVGYFPASHIELDP